MSSWLYAVLCVVAPAAWGVLMYIVFGWVQRRSASPRPDDLPPVDYTI
jgi:hypothetical protein